MFQVSNLKNENQQFDETIEGSNLYDKPLKKGQFFSTNLQFQTFPKNFQETKRNLTNNVEPSQLKNRPLKLRTSTSVQTSKYLSLVQKNHKFNLSVTGNSYGCVSTYPSTICGPLYLGHWQRLFKSKCGPGILQQ